MSRIELPNRPFTWLEAQRWGLSRTMVDDLVSARQLTRVLQGVYQRCDVPTNATTRAQAARLVIRPHVVICDRTAAWLYGIDTFDLRELTGFPPNDTCVLTTASRVRRAGCTGTRRALDPSDVVRLNGLTVTTPLRTAHDLGRRLRPSGALAALDGFLRAGLVTARDLERDLDRYVGQRGVVQLRRLAPLASPLAESPGESWTRSAMIEADLPVPELQIEVWADDLFVARLDLGYSSLKLGVEFDGVDHHSSQAQREHDVARRQQLAALGWTIIVVRKEDLTAERRNAWTDEVRRLLRARES
jgi:hypothetical protein